jgi:hypothetical protein
MTTGTQSGRPPRGRLPPRLDKDELLEVPQPDGTVIRKRRADLDFNDLVARAPAPPDLVKLEGASAKDRRATRELDQHRAELLQLRGAA